MSSRFEDHRGVIQDIVLDHIDAVTEIFTRKGCVRGNHVHEKTIQWTYIVRGELLVASRPDVLHTRLAVAGELIREDPGIPHAWKAIEDTVVLVFTRGPRSGPDYGKDTIRLEEPLLEP